MKITTWTDLSALQTKKAANNQAAWYSSTGWIAKVRKSRGLWIVSVIPPGPGGGPWVSESTTKPPRIMRVKP